MADVKVSALTTAGALSPSDYLLLVQGSSSVKVPLSMLDTYIDPVQSVVTSAQTLGTGDTYVTDSRIVLPQARMRAGVVYRARFVMTKTAAGTAAAVFTVRTGTAGTTADTSRHAYTATAQTAVVDVGFLEIMATFRVVGASAVLATWSGFSHDLASTGLANATRGFMGSTVSGTFDSTTASMGIGLSINAGASSAWTIQQGYAELLNLG